MGGPSSDDVQMDLTVTTSYGFSEKYTLPGNDETAFGRVRDCVNERLKEFKTNG